MYLTIISSGERNWNALVPELACVVSAPDRGELLRLASESIALALEDRPSMAVQLHSPADLPPELRSALDGSEEFLSLDPAPMNPVSSEIERALAAGGVSQAELARRLGTSRSAVNRLLNPFYWGHSLEMLRRVARALDRELHVSLSAKAS